jgi:adenosylhomocysteine nucleosidase
MPQELDAVLADFDADRAENVAGRVFHRGEAESVEAVAVISGIGKTSVAATTTLLIERFGVEHVVLIGVAGAVSRELALGDIVVATAALHHDLDASPIVPRYHVPSLGIDRIPSDVRLSALALAAAADFAAGSGARVRSGLVVSGDRFLGPTEIAELRERLPDALAVEMEGAAVAQVCNESGIPCAIVRSISDDGDIGSFDRFLEREAGRYAEGIVARLLAALG